MTAFTPVQVLKMIGKCRHEADQQHGRDIAEAEPQQKQRRIRDAGDRRADAHERKEDVLGAARAAHDDSDRHARKCRDGKAGEQAHQRVECVVRQNSRDREARERGRDCLERRKEPGRKKAEMGDDFPGAADHDERKRRARDDAPARIPGGHPRERRRGGGGSGKCVVHGVCAAASGRMQEAASQRRVSHRILQIVRASSRCVRAAGRGAPRRRDDFALKPR
ncbi:MAG TPA: hypothetical protein VE909_11375 [Xanthobacteraceae bacterium]|nr:hypothetical protein [Xanthobacteraceae bacterium]